MPNDKQPPESVVKNPHNNPPPVLVADKTNRGTHWQEIHSANRPGDRYIRIKQLHDQNPSDSSRIVPWVTEGNQNAWRKFKHLLIGQPLATSRSSEERVNRVMGLAILSSDALSSVAFATEAALFVLVTGFARDNPTHWIIPISIVICLLAGVVAWSYRQTIFAYPGGGGSYHVAKENLGVKAGLFAAAALIIDYTLNVAVCVASGTANLVSAFPWLSSYALPLMVALVLLLMLGNLRGVRESGLIFAIPVYFFIFSFLLLLGTGLFKVLFTQYSIIPVVPSQVEVFEYNTQPVTLILILQAFSSGCSALTGVEAISNGVPMFKKPESKNAATTLMWMAMLLIIFFMGTSYLADRFQARPNDHETIISQLARVTFGSSTVGYFLVQIATTLILLFSANTSFAGFPRLASLLSKDKYLPHVFAYRGDRLAYSTGIIALGGLAIMLLLIFNGSVQNLIPLFAVGVFLAFTLSQIGMVIHWQKEKTGGGKKRVALRGQLINGLGALFTGLALIIIAADKFLAGAWLVVFLIPLLYVLFQAIYHHYAKVAAQIRLSNLKGVETKATHTHLHGFANAPEPGQPLQILVPIGGLNLVSLSTLNFARTLSEQVTAVFVSDDHGAIEKLRADWEANHPGVPLVVLETPYRSVIRPFLAYLDDIHERNKDERVMVILPEFVVHHWWEQLLHNQTALRLKAVLLNRSGIIVTSVPYHLH